MGINNKLKTFSLKLNNMYFKSPAPIQIKCPTKHSPSFVNPTKNMPINILKKYDFGINLDTNKKKLVVGEHYSLKTNNCDGFSLTPKVYELIGVYDNVYGVDVDSVVMKQVSREESTIFSLTKADCDLLNIPFQQGLQIFPKGMNWECVTQKDQELIKVNLNDLSTYPKSRLDGTIRNIIIKLNNFSSYRGTHVVTPKGNVMEVEAFLKSLKITFKEHIPPVNMCAYFSKGEPIPFNVVTKQIGKKLYDKDCLADLDSTIYIELFLCKQVNKNMVKTVDGVIGIYPETLNGKNVDDLFNIEWSENDSQSKTHHNGDSMIGSLTMKYGNNVHNREYYKDRVDNRMMKWQSYDMAKWQRYD